MGRSYGQPVDLVGVCGETGATGVLLITSAVDDDGVFDGACINPPIWSANVLGLRPRATIMRFRRIWSYGNWDEKLREILRSHTLAGGIKGTHVEDVNALHLSDELQTLETGGLVEIGRNGTGLGTGSKEVLLALDLYISTREIGQYCVL